MRVYAHRTPPEESTMSLKINTNLSAMNALRNLNKTAGEMHTSISRLSSGLRIITAADDPAGLVISENLRTQVLAIDQAIRNSQDSINMTKTAEGALNEIQDLLRSMRALAVHSANTGVVDSAVLDANQAQIRSTIESINRIAAHTAFGTKKLLDGTAGARATVTATNFVKNLYFGGTFNGKPVASGPITVEITQQATRASISTDVVYADANAIVPAGSITINGMAFISSGTESLQELVSKINQMSNVTGVTAQISGTTNVTVDLVQNNWGSNFDVQLFDTNGLLSSSSYLSSTGTNAEALVSINTAEGVQSALFIGGRSAGESGLKLSDVYGNFVTLTEDGNLNMSGPNQVGVLTSGAIQIQFGPNANQFVQLSIPSMFAETLGTSAVPGESVATIDVTTQSGAENAIRIIDDAVTQLARVRGDIGSFQKDFLESNVRSLSVARENLTATESEIRDVDMAAEITNYTRLQILQQSGMAVLAQANQIPQSVLRLLQ